MTGEPDDTTSALVCHDEQFLYVFWDCMNSEFISSYKKCNDPLYNEEAVEIFIASEESYPHVYYEFEVSPSSQLFFANIINPNLTCSNLGTEYQPCTVVEYWAQKQYWSMSWNAYLKVDLKIVGRGKIPSLLKGNLFRIAKSNSSKTRYLAASPTLTSPACFHRPAAFFDLILV